MAKEVVSADCPALYTGEISLLEGMQYEREQLCLIGA